jgi:hypothetical protein
VGREFHLTRERIRQIEAKPPSEPMNPAKESLVQDLPPQANLVLRNARLIEELRITGRVSAGP